MIGGLVEEANYVVAVAAATAQIDGDFGLVGKLLVRLPPVEGCMRTEMGQRWFLVALGFVAEY